MRRIVLCGLFMLLVLGSSTALSIQPAFAASIAGPTTPWVVAHPATATCTGDGCDNLDPILAGCEDSNTKTVKEVQITGAANTPDAGTLADVELRYSYTCGTNYTRFTTFVGNVKALATIERLLAPNISYLKFCWQVSCYAASDPAYPNTYTSWTNMVYAPVTVVARACGTVVSMTTGRTYKACVQG